MSAAGTVSRSRFRRPRNLKLLVGGWGTLLVCLVAFVGPLLLSTSPNEITAAGAFVPPSAEHWLGTDELGRDFFTRIVHGAMISLLVGFAAILIAVTAGLTIGLIAGYYRGVVDAVFMRLMDSLLAFPSLLLALAVTAALGPGLANVAIAIGIVNIPAFARLARSQALAIGPLDYLNAARMCGRSNLGILWSHVLPNSLTPIVVYSATAIAQAILTQASLSFLGLGAAPPTPDWGAMLQSGYNFMTVALWLSVFPGLSIALVSILFIFLGDGLRDMQDPRTRHA